MSRVSKYDRFLHQYAGRHYVAMQQPDGSFVGPMQARLAKRHGAAQFRCREHQLRSAGGYGFSRRVDALHLAARYYRDEVES